MNLVLFENNSSHFRSRNINDTISQHTKQYEEKYVRGDSSYLPPEPCNPKGGHQWISSDIQHQQKLNEGEVRQDRNSIRFPQAKQDNTEYSQKNHIDRSCGRKLNNNVDDNNHDNHMNNRWRLNDDRNHQERNNHYDQSNMTPSKRSIHQLEEFEPTYSKEHYKSIDARGGFNTQDNHNSPYGQKHDGNCNFNDLPFDRNDQARIGIKEGEVSDDEESEFESVEVWAMSLVGENSAES